MKAGESFFPTTVSRAMNWAQSKSLWYIPIRGGCCADELLNTQGCRYDFERFGCLEQTEPNQSDLLIVSGLVTDRAAPYLRDLYSKMLLPRYVLALGSCACSGGLFRPECSYTGGTGLDQVIPVDVYVPGCPPRPEAIMHGLITLQEKISGKK